MLKSKRECTGCAACESICPQNAISMKVDGEGFTFPVINNDMCIQCRLCEKVCHQENRNNAIKRVLAIQTNDELALYNSSSGGAISVIATQFLNDGGCVCAATYNRNDGAHWTIFNKIEVLYSIRGSKYFQIPLSRDIYWQIEDKLSKGIKVLFIGTPCQVSGVAKRIPHKYQHLFFLIDIVCGGIVSPMLEEKYIRYEENKHEQHIKQHYFRSKENGWNREYTTVLFSENGSKIVKVGSEDMFTRAYTSGRFLRESCYGCTFSSRFREGDITVGDCWGIENEYKDSITISKGISLVTCNSSKGNELISKIEDTCIVQINNTEQLLNNNKPLNLPSSRPRMRSYSYRLLNYLPFNIAVNIVCYRRLIKKYILRRKIR